MNGLNELDKLKTHVRATIEWLEANAPDFTHDDRDQNILAHLHALTLTHLREEYRTRLMPDDTATQQADPLLSHTHKMHWESAVREHVTGLILSRGHLLITAPTKDRVWIAEKTAQFPFPELATPPSLSLHFLHRQYDNYPCHIRVTEGYAGVDHWLDIYWDEEQLCFVITCNAPNHDDQEAKPYTAIGLAPGKPFWEIMEYKIGEDPIQDYWVVDRLDWKGEWTQFAVIVAPNNEEDALRIAHKRYGSECRVQNIDEHYLYGRICAPFRLTEG